MGILTSVMRAFGGGDGRSLAEVEADAEKRWQSGDRGGALALCDEGLARWPASALLAYVKASCLFEAGEYAAAAPAFRRAEAVADHPLVLYAGALGALSDHRSGARADLPAPDEPPAFVSVIVCSADDAKFLAVAAEYAALFGSSPHEIIRIGDAKSLCEGYNRGMARALGDILLFSHDDVHWATPDLARRIRAHLAGCDVVGIAGATRLAGPIWHGAGWPHLAGQVGMPATGSPGRIAVTIYGKAAPSLTHGVRALDGVFIAARREVAQSIGFDEQSFDGWHFYDLDFTFRASLAGHRVAVASDLLLVHQSAGQGYETEAWRNYAARFMAKFAGRLDAPAAGSAELCTVVVEGDEEWQGMTALRLRGNLT